MTDLFDLNLRHLRVIPLIANHKSMCAAAEAAGLSQPALTQGLAKIERQLGVRLFDRRPDGMMPNGKGLEFAERIDAAFTHLATGIRGAGYAGRGVVRPERRMTATQLRAMLALAEAGSFVEAARLTGRSLPALHRAVRDLEQLSTTPLVERRGRRVALSDRGRKLARGIRLAASEIVAGIAALRADTRLAGRIVMGAMPLSRARLLPATIAALLREMPEATVDVVEGAWRELVELLHDGMIDFMVGALRDSLGSVELDQTPLFEDRLAVVARTGHPLAGVPEPSLDQLAGYPWIVGSAHSPMKAHWRALFAGLRPPPAPIECGSVMVIRGVLLESDCLTLLSSDQIAMEIKAGLLTIVGRHHVEIARTIGITTRAGWRPSVLQEHFLALLRDNVPLP